jgi:hypothetical protein
MDLSTIIITSIITAIITGGVSALATVAAIKVDIQWLKESVNKAHDRIDKVVALKR